MQKCCSARSAQKQRIDGPKKRTNEILKEASLSFEQLA